MKKKKKKRKKRKKKRRRRKREKYGVDVDQVRSVTGISNRLSFDASLKFATKFTTKLTTKSTTKSTTTLWSRTASYPCIILSLPLELESE